MSIRCKTGPRVPDFALPYGVKATVDGFSATVRLPFGHEHVKRGFDTPDKAAAYIKACRVRAERRKNPAYEAFMADRLCSNLNDAG